MINCWKCEKPIDESDNFCRHCGVGQGRNVAWYYHWWGVVAIMMCIGPLALPYVIKSPVLNTKAKWLWSFIVTAFTVFIAAAIYLAFKKMFAVLNAAMTGNIGALGL